MRVVLTLVLVAVAGCSSSAMEICHPNLVVECGCADGSLGKRVCLDDGTSFGACACGTEPAGPALSSDDGGGATLTPPVGPSMPTPDGGGPVVGVDAGGPDAAGGTPVVDCGSDACPPVPMASFVGTATAFAVRRGVAFYAQQGGSVRRISLDGTGFPIELAWGQNQVTALAADDTHLYIVARAASAGHGAVNRVLLQGGAGQVEAVAPARDFPQKLVLTDSDVYFGQSRASDAAGGLFRASKEPGATPIEVLDATVSVKDLAGDAGGLFLADGAQKSVVFVAADGVSTAELAVDSATSPQRLRADATHIYYTVNSTAGVELRRVPREGGASETLFTAPLSAVDFGELELGADHAYLTAHGDNPHSSDGALYRVTKDGSEARVVARSSRMTALAEEAGAIYLLAGNHDLTQATVLKITP